MNASNAPIADPATAQAAPASAPEQVSDPNTVTLRFPVKVMGVEYTSITLKQRLKVKHMLQAESQASSSGGQEVVQFALMSGVAPEVIRELDSVDYGALQAKVKDFLS